MEAKLIIGAIVLFFAWVLIANILQIGKSKKGTATKKKSNSPKPKTDLQVAKESLRDIRRIRSKMNKIKSSSEENDKILYLYQTIVSESHTISKM